MALDKATTGLTFTLNADSKEAIADLNSFKEFMGGLLEGIKSEAKEQFARIRTEVKGVGEEAEKAKKPTKDLFDTLNIKGDIQAQIRGLASGLGGIGEAAAGSIAGAGGLALGLAGVAAGLVTAGLHAAEYGGHLSDLAAKTNLSTDTLQTLQLAATLTGQSLEQTAGSAVIFQKKLDDANAGGKEMRATFKALGVDLNGDVDTAFRQTLESLSKMEDGSRKTALTLELFGRSGASLLPILSQVGGSFKNLEDRARELGIVMSKDGVAAADQFGDQIDLLKLQLTGLANQIGVKVVPVLNGLVGTLRFALRDTKKFFGDVAKDISNFGFVGPNVFSSVAANLATDQALSDAADKAKKEAPPPKARRGGGGARSSVSTSDPATSAKLQALKIEEQAAQRLADFEINASRRAFDEREINIEQLEKLIIDSEFRMLAAKEATFAEERRLVEESTAKQLAQAKLTEKQREQIQEQGKTKLAEINEREAAAQQKADEAVARVASQRLKIEEAIIESDQKARLKLTEEESKAEIERIRVAADQRIISEEAAARRIAEIEQSLFDAKRARLSQERAAEGADTKEIARVNNELVRLAQERATAEEAAQLRILEAQRRDLASLRAYLEQRNRLLEDIRKGEVDALNRRASDLERRAQNSPQFQDQARAARQAAQIAEEQLLNDQNQARIRAAQTVAENAAVTEQQRLEARKNANLLLEQEEQRHQEETKRIQNDGRSQELQSQGFDTGLSDAIAEQEQLLGRTLTLMETIRLSSKLMADDLKATIEPIGSVFVQMKDAVVGALAGTVAAFLSGKTSIRKAAADLYAAALAPLKAYLLKLSKAEFALAARDLAAQNYGGAALHGIAGVGLAAAAALVDVGGALIGGSGGTTAPSAGGGSGGAQNAASTNARTIDQDTIRDQRPIVNITLHGELRDGVLQVVHQDYVNNGQTRQLLRRDLLNES